MSSTSAEAESVDVSISILSWNAKGWLRRTLASLYVPHDPEVQAAWERIGKPIDEIKPEAVTWEVIVVDQESLDGSADMVESEFPQAHLIRQKPNVGFAGGNNIAWKHARGRYFVLLNSDTVVRPGWLTELVAYAEAHPNAGLIGPKVLNPDGTLQFSCRRFPSLGAGVFRHTPLDALFPKNRFSGDYLMRDWDHAEPRNVDWLSGAVLLARREMIEQIGGLDQRYFMYFEDVDWAMRAHKAGWEVHYIPSPEIIHEVGRSSDRRPKRMIVMHHESAYHYFCQHAKIGQSHAGRLALALGLGIRLSLTLARNEVIRWQGRRAKAKRERKQAPSAP